MKSGNPCSEEERKKGFQLYRELQKKSGGRRNYSGGIEIIYQHPLSQRIQKCFANWMQITP